MRREAEQGTVPGAMLTRAPIDTVVRRDIAARVGMWSRVSVGQP
jgi:hypothetical protein